MEQSPTTDDRADEDEDPENRTAQHERAAARLGRLSPSCRLGGTPPPRTSTVAGCARELPRGHVGRRREDVVLRNLVDMTITSARFARKAFGATVVSLGIVLVAHALAPR